MADEVTILSVGNYLISKVKFEVPEDTVKAILVDRELDYDAAYMDSDRNAVRLAYADLLKWIILGPSKFNNTSDTDNGWTHSGGGYEMSDNDISALKAEANAIYAELEPSSELKKKSVFRITSHGIKRANYTAWGRPIPHVIK